MAHSNSWIISPFLRDNSIKCRLSFVFILEWRSLQTDEQHSLSDHYRFGHLIWEKEKWCVKNEINYDRSVYEVCYSSSLAMSSSIFRCDHFSIQCVFNFGISLHSLLLLLSLLFQTFISTLAYLLSSAYFHMSSWNVLDPIDAMLETLPQHILSILFIYHALEHQFVLGTQ